MKATALASALSLALAASLLTACASTGNLVTQGKPLAVDDLAAQRSLAAAPQSPAAWPQDDWWAQWGDPQLDQLMRDALDGQPSLRIADARVRQAQAVAGVAGAALLPQVNATLKGTQQRFSENSIYPPALAGRERSINDGQIGASYELDFWGKNRAALDAALDRAHAAQVDAQAARLVLTTGIARLYLRLDTVYAQRDLARDTLRHRQEILALVKRRVAMQIDSALEQTQAEAALPAARAQIAALEEAIALANNQIAALQGKGPDAGLAIERPHLASVGPVALPTDLPAELLGRRPDIVAERWRVEATTQDMAVARAGFYPNVTLNAFVGFQSIGLADFLAAGSRMLGIGPAISLPVFDGGRLRANLALHQADHDAAIQTYNATVIAALHDVVAQLVSLKWSADESAEQDQALILARHAYELAQDRYRSGLASYLQVLAAETQVLAQQRQVIDSAGRQRELRLNLIRALGGGYVPAASPEPHAAS